MAQGNEVKEFKQGYVYVVEFWATWCGPCRDSIPHITELAKKHPEVTFIGVSIGEQDQANVQPFVKEMGDKMNYNVAMDSQSSPTAGSGFMFDNWMNAAGQNSIPTAFIVDRDSKIVWIGHPMAMADPLQKVLDRKWDAAASQLSSAGKAPAESVLRKELNKLGILLRAKNYPELLKEAEVLQAMSPIPGERDPVEAALTFKLMAYGRLKQWDAYYVGAKELLDKRPTAPFIASIAWTIACPDSKFEGPRDYKLALKAGLAAAKATNFKDALALDSLAWAYFGDGQKAKAIEVETKALALADDPDTRGAIQKSLKQMHGA
ncbi:MAG: TlpA family protein disulfide reductase [Armatimonadetes bacterium]|nr:TlpA family protein disulfide reductase [Armatimonadota bacterium]